MKKFRGKYTIKDILAGIKKHGGLMPFVEAEGISRRGVQYFMRKHEIEAAGIVGVHSNKNVSPVAAGEIGSPDGKRETLKGKRFVFTCAQNNTFINKNFWQSLQVFCEHKGAKLHVSRFAYNKAG